jgi:REP element-mobilizing transposase RayT
MYHVMSRGDRRERIFLDDIDRQDFIKTLAEACQNTGWQVHAYCLMPNHYHIALETPEPNLVAGMAWLQSTYTIRLHHRHQLFGHVFSGRYKSQLVEGSGNGYLKTACESFKREALARMEGSLGGHHAGELHREVAQAKAERIVAEELQRQGWQPDDLVTRRKNDPAKLEIAARLRRETTLPLKAIAARVHLGTSKTANTKLHKCLRGAPANDSSQAPLVI